ncbi:MAG: response regulator transcription factor [Clostridia bacterium]|nr:response regulator transcription factor [Clostridia bacterium]
MNNNKYKILLVEEEENIRVFVNALLDSNGYQVVFANGVASGKMMYNSYVPDLVILDLGLPDGDGSEVLAHIREKDFTPVIVLSARSEESEKVRLLDMGANDYVTKPFGTSELLARVRSSLRDFRRISGKESGAKSIFKLSELEIRYDSRRVFVGRDEIKLTQTEYNILAYLSENTGKVMTYSAIIKAIWREYPTESNVKRLQVNMANIRKKLGTVPGGVTYIVNELGVGYRMKDELN